jgi:hypothetical protein
MEGPQSVPYDAIERLCLLIGVRFDVYDAKGSLNRVHDRLKKKKCRCYNPEVKNE